MERRQPSEEGYPTRQLSEMRKNFAECKGSVDNRLRKVIPRSNYPKGEKGLPNEGVRSELRNLLTMSPPCVCWVNGEKPVGQALFKQGSVSKSVRVIRETLRRIIRRTATAFWADFSRSSENDRFGEGLIHKSFLASILVMSSGPFSPCLTKESAESPPNEMWTHFSSFRGGCQSNDHCFVANTPFGGHWHWNSTISRVESVCWKDSLKRNTFRVTASID
ncbi:hypothetical protein CSKR_113965 [Clonorchis sinensis]|uniref:Uncharacterized protein n=1 Tax=Clonorchis sinensis TaxID=79923 RepID=A0A3R7H4J3_CLOSI|nr:hypothetical protein CSKR_113965 [Clonorchis sinensis]